MDLEIDGVQTIKIFDHDYENEFIAMISDFPEYSPEAAPIVLGGFGAFGNPSSFHHPFIKSIRKQVFDKLIESQILKKNDFKLEVLFDRAMHRYPGQSPSAETAHRDVSPMEHPDDIIFGGWVNLSKNDQFFVCLPGSHKKSNLKSGFMNKLSKEELLNFKNNKKIKTVKPGELIIFYQDILHEVLAKKYKYHQFRLFMGWRLTKSNNLLFGNNKEHSIDNLAIPLLPSGQTPPVFAQCHHIFKNRPFNWISKEYPDKHGTLLDWFRQTFNENIQFGRFIESLTHYDLPFEGYSPEEKDFMTKLHEHF